MATARRIVVKVGSSLVTNEGRGVDADAIGNWARQMAALAHQGRLPWSTALSLMGILLGTEGKTRNWGPGFPVNPVF